MSIICDDLRAAILQSAMQGKLTKQLPEDGDASELLKTVTEARSSLVKNKKESEIITDEEKPFLIPDSWSWARVGDIFSHNTGKTKNVSQNTSGEPRKYITTSNLYWNYFDFSKVGKMNFKEEELEKYTVRKGDLLVCEGGDFGRTAIWNYDEEVCFQNHIHRLRFFYQMDANFFYWLFYYYKHSGLIKGKGIGIQGLSSGALHNIVFPIPPLAEQKRIVKKVDELMARVADLEKSADALASLKKAFPSNIKAALLQAAMQGKLTEQLPEDGGAEELLEQIKTEKDKLIAEGKIKKQKALAPITDDEIPFSIPGNWQWARWGDIVNVVSARRVHQSDWRKSGIPFYRAREIGKLADYGSVDNDLFITQELFDKYSESGVPKKDDLMVTAVGTLGKTYVVKESDKFYYKDASVLCFENYCCDPYFLKYMMEANVMKGQIESNSGGTTVGTLTIVRMNNYILPLPPLTEQKRIVERLNTLMQNIDVVSDLIASE